MFQDNKGISLSSHCGNGFEVAFSSSYMTGHQEQDHRRQSLIDSGEQQLWDLIPTQPAMDQPAEGVNAGSTDCHQNTQCILEPSDAYSVPQKFQLLTKSRCGLERV